MSWFARIEETCAAFIERAFANMFPSDLEPAQIARKLVATMEARTQPVESTLRAPGTYAVYVHNSDYDRLSTHREYLQEEWAALLADVAQRVGIVFENGGPRVELHEGIGMVAGAVEIETPEPEEAPQPVDARRAARKSYSLRMVKGMPIGAVFEVNGAARVGRNRDNEIFLADPSVSRNHALVDVHAGNLVVRDAGSTNGTYVNGERVQLRTLAPGDLVAFGKTQLRVEAQEA